MTHTTGTFLSSDGLTLRTRRWEPRGEVRSRMILIHGIHEHSGRYAQVATELMRHGIEIVALDLRGHGESEGERAMVESFDEYIQDVRRYVDEVVSQRADVPLVLFGHSMGGLIVSATVVDRGTEGLSGVALSSPALALPDSTPKLLQLAAPYVSKWFPRLPVSKVDVTKISRDAAVQRQYRADPLNTVRGVRARVGYGIVHTIEHVRENPGAFDVPLYAYHGTADQITDPSGTQWLAENAATPDVTLRLWDGLYHETHNEPERDDVIGALAEWIAEREAA